MSRRGQTPGKKLGVTRDTVSLYVNLYTEGLNDGVSNVKDYFQMLKLVIILQCRGFPTLIKSIKLSTLFM